jgi:hypothetical protein
VYADPELVIIAAISENDIAARRATILVRIKEMMTDGPAYIAAACPLKVNIPVPEKKVQNFLCYHYFQCHLPMRVPKPIPVKRIQFNAGCIVLWFSISACSCSIDLREMSRLIKCLNANQTCSSTAFFDRISALLFTDVLSDIDDV